MAAPELTSSCTRCGKCCVSSTPSLQVQDLPLLLKGDIPKRDLYTVRVGELIWDNINQRHVFTPQELIKVKEKEGSRECIYHVTGPSQCTIYPKRPSQCRAFKCWDTTEFEKLFKGPKLSRFELISDPILLGLVKEHEKRCSYKELERSIKEIPKTGEKAIEEIIEILRFDTELRPFVALKLGLPLEETDLFFGRPLRETIIMFGLQVRREPDGTFFLTVSH